MNVIQYPCPVGTKDRVCKKDDVGGEQQAQKASAGE